MSEKLTFPQRVERLLVAAKNLRDAVAYLSPAVEVVEEEAHALTRSFVIHSGLSVLGRCDYGGLK
jgi:hypothetical protein